MTPNELETILAGLKGFQRNAVAHIVKRLYRDPTASGRFLVADETGLGKSVVARGVIASAIEELQRHDHVSRIDVVYICSNSDLAKQNLRRLNVTGDPHIGLTSRLTMLALEGRRLNGPGAGGAKRVNLVSFTPGTSFDMGWQTGSSNERALLHILLNGMDPSDAEEERASALFFQGGVQRLDRFRDTIDSMRRQLDDGPDPVIQRQFNRGILESGLFDLFNVLRTRLIGLDAVPEEIAASVRKLTSTLRAELARSSVDALEPDLVILDEFQRFRHLIDPDSGSDASELAHHLFNYVDAKVLLLSATPYKPYTTVEGDGEDEHYRDFMTTLAFLAKADAPSLDAIRLALQSYRAAVVDGGGAGAEATALRDVLVPYMTRSERPRLEEGRDLLVRRVTSDVPLPRDLSAYVALQRFAREVGAPVTLDYWKSIPYFASFMEGYKPGERARKELRSGSASAELRSSIRGLRSIDVDAVRAFEQVDFANARLRAFASETIDRGWWRLLWMPPSMPYLQPGSVYAPLSDGSVTKRLVFSAWSSVPTSVASLLSYEAERRMVEGSALTQNTAEARRSPSARLDYVVRDERPASMSTLAIFWPHPALAEVGHQLSLIGDDGAPVSQEGALELVNKRLAVQPATEVDGGEDDSAAPTAWDAFFSWPGGVPTGMARRSDAAAFWIAGKGGGTHDDSVSDSGGAIREHAKAAFTLPNVRRRHDDLAAIALHSPGNIAYRALFRICDTVDGEMRIAVWRCAARLANGIRTLFNRTDVMFLIDQVSDAGLPYWRAVLDYCADGNLQAVLDEYLFQLKMELAGTAVDATELAQITDRAVEALTLRTSRYVARTADESMTRFNLTVRFALRYGGSAKEAESARQPEVRNAFNSPFWPFVLASTSVGQEGIDFHWWSHSVTHWNLPSNPVDFEQREGRVNRFGGHAVRKNVATRHRTAAITAGKSGAHPWSVAFAAAEQDHPELGEFSPWWIYPGAARVERLLVNFPLSRDNSQYERLREALTLYRLTLGQPRQEDMVELLRGRGIEEGGVAPLDLSPPPQ